MAETCRHGVVGVEGRQTMNESSGSVEVTRTLVGKQGVSVVELSRAGARNRQEGQGRGYKMQQEQKLKFIHPSID